MALPAHQVIGPTAEPEGLAVEKLLQDVLVFLPLVKDNGSLLLLLMIHFQLVRYSKKYCIKYYNIGVIIGPTLRFLPNLI